MHATTPTLMLCAALALPAAAPRAARAAETPVPVPSGQSVTPIDSTLDDTGPVGLTARFRFLAPAIARQGGSIDFGKAGPDMQYLCDSYALPRLPATGPQVAQVIISLSDRVVEFGQPDPEATQFFEAYSIAGGTCIWEPL